MQHTRRFMVTGSIRRPARDSSRMPSTLRAIWGAALREYWDADTGIALVGGEVDTWAGQMLGISLPAGGAGSRPTYTAHNANFGNHASVNTADVANKYLKKTAMGNTLYSTSDRIYCGIVGRFSTAWSAQRYLLRTKDGSFDITFQELTAGVASIQATSAVTAQNKAMSNPQAPALFESWLTGTQAWIAYNGSETLALAYTGSQGNRANTFTIGANDGTDLRADAEIALVLFANMNIATHSNIVAWRQYVKSTYSIAAL